MNPTIHNMYIPQDKAKLSPVCQASVNHQFIVPTVALVHNHFLKSDWFNNESNTTHYTSTKKEEIVLKRMLEI